MEYLSLRCRNLLIPVLAFSIWILLSKQENLPATVEAKSWIEINAPETAVLSFTT